MASTIEMGCGSSQLRSAARALLAGITDEPLAEGDVQRDFLVSRSLACVLDHRFVGSESNPLHLASVNLGHSIKIFKSTSGTSLPVQPQLAHSRTLAKQMFISSQGAEDGHR